MLKNVVPNELRHTLAWRRASWLYHLRAHHRRPWPANLEQFLGYYFQHFPAHGTIVQIGANDGVSGDPLHSFIRDGSIQAVLVEPVPSLFARLQHTYDGKAGVQLVNCAVAAEPGDRNIYVVDNARGVYPTFFDQLGSFDRSVLEKQAREHPGILEDIVPISVPCLSPDMLLEQARFDRVTVLQTDVEGYDLDILELIDLDLWRTEVVIFEHAHLSAPRYQRYLDRLRANGFQIRDGGSDTFGWRDYP
jgi:FkbM family methyltransferase